MANETHNGNKNRSKAPAPAENEGLKPTGKDNSECATLRMGKLPKAEAVRDAKCDEGAAVKAAAKQNRVDGVEGSQAVIPNRNIPAPPDTHGCEK